MPLEFSSMVRALVSPVLSPSIFFLQFLPSRQRHIAARIMRQHLREVTDCIVKRDPSLSSRGELSIGICIWITMGRHGRVHHKSRNSRTDKKYPVPYLRNTIICGIQAKELLRVIVNGKMIPFSFEFTNDTR